MAWYWQIGVKPRCSGMLVQELGLVIGEGLVPSERSAVPERARGLTGTKTVPAAIDIDPEYTDDLAVLGLPDRLIAIIETASSLNSRLNFLRCIHCLLFQQTPYLGVHGTGSSSL